MHKVLRSTLVGCLLSVSAIGTASAQVMVGSQNTVQANNFPFGSSVTFNEFQQIYASSLFTGPLTIGAISLFNTRGTGNFQVGTFDVVFGEQDHIVPAIAKRRNVDLYDREAKIKIEE